MRYFKIAQKVANHLGYFCYEILSPRTFKNRPIWSHCAPIQECDCGHPVAIVFKNLAIKHMAAKDKTRFNEFLEDLAKWRPCAISLRQSGFPFIFNDTAVSEEADATDEVGKLRTKFFTILRTSRKGSNLCKIDFLAPFKSMIPFQFRQIVNKMEAFVQGGCTAPGDADYSGG